MSGRTKRRRGEAQAAPRPQMPPKMHAHIPGGSWDVFQTLRGFIATWLELARAECGSKPRFWKILFKRSPTIGHRGGEKHLGKKSWARGSLGVIPWSFWACVCIIQPVACSLNLRFGVVNLTMLFNVVVCPEQRRGWHIRNTARGGVNVLGRFLSVSRCGQGIFLIQC